MPPLTSAIKIPDDSYVYQPNNSSNFIPKLSKMNIFLGENNSGKSRLLRQLVKNNITYIPTDEKFEQLITFVKKIKTRFEDYIEKYELGDKYQKIMKIDTVDGINSSFNMLNQIEDLKDHLNVRMRDNNQIHRAGDLIKIFREELKSLDESLQYEQSFVDWFKTPIYTKYYIPILRGMRPLDENEDLYNIRTVKDYFSGTDNSPFEIFTGINSYKQIMESLLGNLTNRRLVKEYEEYLSETFFEGKHIALIPSIKSDVLTIKIGDEKEQPIYNLGDGIQTIIILTLPLFLNKGKNLLIFIEEPEIYLHPALQRKLLETLLKHEGFENYQYFITTHSNHFLDLTMDYPDISIYSLRKYFDKGEHEEKDAKYIIENLFYGDISALEQLGVRNSSVFLSNCTIWVEGITDRLYFRHYLQIYLKYLPDTESARHKELREDYHFSFVEYSGNNIKHWSFLQEPDGEDTITVKSLCGKLFLIADGDNGNKAKRHQKLRDELGDRFYLLECKEVENLLSKEVLVKVIEGYGDDFSQIDFSEEDYKNRGLGEFIDEMLGDSRKRSYSDNGPIKGKPNFCKKAIKCIEKWDDLSEEAKKLTIKIYNFICKHNGIQQKLSQ